MRKHSSSSFLGILVFCITERNCHQEKKYFSSLTFRTNFWPVKVSFWKTTPSPPSLPEKEKSSNSPTSLSFIHTLAWLKLDGMDDDSRWEQKLPYLFSRLCAHHFNSHTLYNATGKKKRAGGTKWGALHYRQTWIIPVDSKARFLPTIQVQCFVEKDTYLISMGLSNEVKRSLFHSSLHWVSVYFFSKKNSVFFALGINLQRKFSVWKCAPQQKVLCEKC